MERLVHGSLEIYGDVLGVGSYGKVCKAKYGQLPCAAKLLHETMFEGGDPGRHQFARKFHRECQFLSMIKHPNIIQYLGTSRDPRSGRLILMMELMDENLTGFLERSPGPLPYHIQLNICHDVALALSYLHANNIIHRDLSSNNVLLIGEAARAKVADFGMSKLVDHVTPLTQCPGAQVYMPPEALTLPTRYTNKLDCFSNGVLTIQVVSRKYPSPSEDATIAVEDERSPTGYVRVPIPEAERRREDIEHIVPTHPLLPIAMGCIKDRDEERPSAGEICERLAVLKKERRYAVSIQQSKITTLDFLRLQNELISKDQRITELETEIQRARNDIESRHQIELQYKDELIRDCQTAQNELSLMLRRERAEQHQELEAKDSIIKKLQERQSPTARRQVPSSAVRWRREAAPPGLGHSKVSAAMNDTAYFYHYDSTIYSYTVSKNKWSRLPPCKYRKCGLAIIDGHVTTVGGFKPGAMALHSTTDTLLSYIPEKFFKWSWQEVLPHMPTRRAQPAVVATDTHLVVAGGLKNLAGMDEVEVLDRETMEWFKVQNLPERITPQMTLCSGCLYVSHHATVFSCSLKKLCDSIRLPTSSQSGMWGRVADIPVQYNTMLITAGERLLAIGGSKTEYGDDPVRSIHSYNSETNTWNSVARIPATQPTLQAAVFSKNEIAVIVGSYIHIGQL